MYYNARQIEEDLHKLEEEQLADSAKIIFEGPDEAFQLVAGVDVAYSEGVAYSAAVVLDDELELVEKASAQCVTEFPYIPGFLSYRELKPAKLAVDKLTDYDALMVNGHGLAHPRGFGLASHLGLRIGKPTLGVARRLLVGDFAESHKDDTLVLFNGRIIGARHVSPTGAPVYVSVGHMISLDAAVELVRDYTIEGRLPEPLRLAHEFARMLMEKS
jgi:deoxyribonuclease V